MAVKFTLSCWIFPAVLSQPWGFYCETADWLWKHIVREPRALTAAKCDRARRGRWSYFAGDHLAAAAAAAAAAWSETDQERKELSCHTANVIKK